MYVGCKSFYAFLTLNIKDFLRMCQIEACVSTRTEVVLEYGGGREFKL